MIRINNFFENNNDKINEKHDNYEKIMFIYKAALKANEFTDVNHRAELFEIRFQKMISSNMYAKHNVYPTMDMTKIYAVIAMCLELKNDDYSDMQLLADL